MADLYGTTTPTSHEPEEISNFLNQLIHNSSSTSPSSPCFSFKTKYIHSLSPPPPPPLVENSDSVLLPLSEDRRHLFGRSINPSVLDSVSGDVNFSNFVANCVGAVDSDTNDSEKDLDASDVPSDHTGRSKTSSSKRSRAAEVHNLSEKRRRSKINEKMKALQNLIPNSNKTDKASMLDEAIEYLKQLQLQVQMLTMRNGLSLHQMWLPGVLQPLNLSQTGMVFEDGSGLLNTNRRPDTFPTNEENSTQTAFNLSNQCTISNQPIAIPSAPNINTPETSFGLEPLIHAHYGNFSLASSSKEICGEDTPQLHLDMNFIGKNSSSGVS